MIKKWLRYAILFLFAFSPVYSQTYQLIGNPVNTAGWSLIPSAGVSGDFIRLTSDQVTQVGGVKLNAPINLKYCKKWTVEFDFRIDGSGRADGLSFWYLANPPSSYTNGSGLGIPSNATGLMVGFDIFNNTDESAMSKVHVLYGTNNGYQANIEFNNTPGSTFHSPNLNPGLRFTGPSYKHVEVTGTEDPSNPSRWIINLKINGVTIINQSFAPSGGAVGMTNGYFGFSASTGAYNARHSIKNVKIYTDKVPILKDTVIKTFCAGNETIDLTSFNSEFTSNPNNYTFTYFIQGSSTPITNPSQFQFNTNTTVSLLIKDKSGLLCDNNDAKILLTFKNKISLLKDTFSKIFCTGNTTADLTSMNSEFVANPNNYTFTYFIQGSSAPITNPSNFQFNTNTTVTLLIKDKSGALCDNDEAKILLTFKNCIDSDNDGLMDIVDLDDDNDGIPDIIECPGNDIVNNGSFKGNTNGWTLQLGGWFYSNNSVSVTANNIINKDISQTLNNLQNTNNFIPVTLTLGAQDGSQAGGSTAKLEIFLNNTLYATIDNSTVRNPGVNNITITLSNGATSNFVPFTTALVNGFTTRTFTLNIPNNSIPDTSSLIFRVHTGIDDWSLTDVSVKAFTCDTDGDGIFNHLDLDSDNDGCFDALEGDEKVLTSQINTNGSISGAVDAQGVPQLVNTGGSADIGGDQGQGVGFSQTAMINTCNDIDNDGIPDYLDLDNDNDGILDTDEGVCSNSSLDAGWFSNVPPGTKEQDQYCPISESNGCLPGGNPAVVGTSYPMSWGTGLTVAANNTAWKVGGVNSASYLLAKNDGDYIQYGFKTPSNLSLYRSFSTFRWRQLGGYKMSVEVSGDGFSSPGILLLEDAQLSQSAVYSNLLQRVFLKPNTTYTFRIYIYGAATATTLVDYDDFQFGTCVAKDTDGDGIPDYLDLDSDNDGCFDSLEGDENVLTSQINTNGSISGPVDAQGVPQFVNAGGAADIGGDQGQGIGFSQNSMINTCNDIDNDGIPDYIDLDNDNDGILDETECPSQFSWTGPISFSANNTVAQGTISGIPYTLTSNQPMIPMSGIYNHSLFPAPYGVPNNNPSIGNSQVSSNTLTFAQPMIDPVLVFASVGQQGLHVPIKFNIPVQVLWSKDITIDSPTQLTGKEGFVIVKIPGIHSSITFNYTVAEYYANFTFGAATKNCDTDGDGIPDYLDLDSDNDGCFDSLEGGENVLTSQLNADGSISGPVDAQGVPQLVNPGGAADTGSDQGQGMGSSKDDTINPCQCTDPTITVSSSTLCFGGSVTLTSSEATGNLWSTGETTQSITVTTAGTYTLTYSNGICTPPVASVTITAEADPDLQITGNLILCETANQLTAHANGSGNTYTWSDGTTGNVISVSTPGIYTVTVTTPAGCQYQKSEEVVQGIVPEVSNAALELCSDSATAVFDLTSAQNAISTTTGVTFTFYQNQADALAGNTNTIANPTAYSSGNAVVYVRVISPDACAKIAELQLTVNTTIAPVITASSSTICFGGNVTLTSSQATGNLWSSGETTQSITVTTAGTYTLTYSNGACTAPVASVTITAEADPDLKITGNLILCENANQLTVHANGSGNTYTWSDGTTGNIISVVTPGIYTVTVTTPAGCQYQASAEVVQGVVPKVNNAALELCSDSATAIFDLTSAQNAISTTTGVTFSFYQNQADALAGNTNTIGNPATYSSGNAVIYVRVISPDACAKIAELQLTVNVKPVPIITASSNVICNNTPITLTSNFATGNLWSTGETTQTITVSAGGIYTLINNNGICTSEPVSVTILQDTDPNVQITGNLMFCEGDSTVLTATANGSGITFSWSNGATGPVNTVTAPGLYTVTATTALGCQYQQSVQVNMDPLIIVTINPPQDVITCLVPEITLDATASVYEPGATFLWTATGGGNIISGADTLTPVVDKGGVYTLTIISATPLGCTKQSSVTVFENTTPPPLILTASAYTICKGESVTITASGAQTYAWAGLPGTSSIQTFTPDATTTYTVTGTGANGCTTEKSITVIVVPAIVSSLSNIEICEGFKGVLNAGAGPNYTYSWSTGETSQIIYPTLEGVYTVTISNGVCSKVFSATVGYHTVPEIIEINYKNDNLTILAKNNENTPLEYSIDNGFTWQSSNIFYNVFKNTEYMVRVRNTRISCYALASYYTFFMPNAITPNGDGYNDVIDFSGITKYKNFSGKIFDRYGVEIFTVTKEKPIWDGKYLARVIPTATYWYVVSWEDTISGKPIKMSGWILLKNRN
ncbi:T9SS type B sorting domain-containing protein [Chryseobacterium sp. MYb264]|uniref:T9SS type B sorting domain-containing protein n=1 Tax=Chryseobacterium sp. MYb264 TaxID=2745153 RepID=UPI002E1253AB|nr:T9SS type B sorting domain-containing protein [Chryseobacterium sp. MYb264]